RGRTSSRSISVQRFADGFDDIVHRAGVAELVGVITLDLIRGGQRGTQCRKGTTAVVVLFQPVGDDLAAVGLRLAVGDPESLIVRIVDEPLSAADVKFPVPDLNRHDAGFGVPAESEATGMLDVLDDARDLLGVAGFARPLHCLCHCHVLSWVGGVFTPESDATTGRDRKSTRLNSSHVSISYA